MDKEIFYTTGELAEIAGITYKSIRIYVEKGLLTPDKITESGYKLFSRRSVEKLQRILMFKYLDFTLEEIGQMLEYENIQESLGKQLELIELKITHLNQIKKAVEDIVVHEKSDAEDGASMNLEVLKNGVNLFNASDRKRLIKALQKEMAECADRMEYEQAAVYRDQINEIIEKYGK